MRAWRDQPGQLLGGEDGLDRVGRLDPPAAAAPAGDAHFIATSSGLVAMQKASIGGPSQSAARSGPASVMFFGTISPTTVCRKTTTPSASTNATGCTAPSGSPIAWNGPSSRCARAGSAIAPRPSEQMVMPSCAPAIISGIWFIADSAQRAGWDAAASGSMTVRRDAISANSPPTKNPLPSSSTTVISRSVTSVVRSSGRRLRRHPDLLDPVPVHLDHGELPAALLDASPRRPGCARAGPSGSRPASRTAPRAAGTRSARPARPRAARRRPGHVRSPPGTVSSIEPDVRLDRRVVLVGDLPDQLLDQVLDGDHAVGAAVLVDHDRQVGVGARAARPAPRPGPGSPARSTGSRATAATVVLRPAGRRYAERVGHPDHAGDQVERVLVHREAGVPGLAGPPSSSSATVAAVRQRRPRRRAGSSPRRRASRRTGSCAAAASRSPSAARRPAPRSRRAGPAPPASGRWPAPPAARRRAGGPASWPSRSAPGSAT